MEYALVVNHGRRDQIVALEGIRCLMGLVIRIEGNRIAHHDLADLIAHICKYPGSDGLKPAATKTKPRKGYLTGCENVSDYIIECTRFPIMETKKGKINLLQ